MKRSYPITVRTGDEGDAAAVVGIWNASFRSVLSAGSGRREPYGTHDYLGLISVADLMVAEQAGGIHGTITLLDPVRTLGSIAAEGELEITLLAVAPPARRRGIARLLLACAHGEAARRGARALVLWTRPAQIEAQQLYPSLGYRQLDERTDPDGEGGQRIVYRLAMRRSGRSFATAGHVLSAKRFRSVRNSVFLYFH